MYQNGSECVAQLNNMASRAKIETSFNDISLTTGQYIIMCQDSGEPSMALGLFCFELLPFANLDIENL